MIGTDLIVFGQRMLRVSTTCWIRRHHKCNGSLGLQFDNTVIKWYFNVWIEGSEIRVRYRPGGTSWCWEPADQMGVFIPADHSLSRMCRRVWRPRYVMFL